MTTPWREPAICVRICPCCAAGKTSIRRSTVDEASWVCSVAKTRWPVSAAVSAVEIVEVAHLAEEDHVGVLAERAARRLRRTSRQGRSRWLTTQLLCRWRNSIGSSIVMM